MQFDFHTQYFSRSANLLLFCFTDKGVEPTIKVSKVTSVSVKTTVTKGRNSPLLLHLWQFLGTGEIINGLAGGH